MEIWKVNTKNLSAMVIHLGMKIYCILRGIKIPNIIYNHALIYDNKNDIIYEADFPRVIKMKKNLWYDIKKNKKAIIQKNEIKISEDQELILRNYLEDQIGKRYEIKNFWWHLLKIFTNKWSGSKTDDKHYCIELVLHCINKISEQKYDPYLNPIEFNSISINF